MASHDWPELSLADWEPTYRTLHRWTQMVGKVRLARASPVNHWWHVPLYVTTRGLTTSPMPCDGRYLTLTFDFRAHELVADVSEGAGGSFALEPVPVAEFYARLLRLLAQLGAATPIWPTPVEVIDATPFPSDRHHAAYDRDQIGRLHRLLLHADRVFHAHRGRFLGKCSPVHLFWGAFDLAVTRFSGRANPTPPEDPVMREAYSHELISHGFWPGGDWPVGGRVDEAVFYAYAVPAPSGFESAKVGPPAARYSATLGEFLLPYAAVQSAADPDGMLLEFMESTYLAAARGAGWDVETLRHGSHRSLGPER